MPTSIQPISNANIIVSEWSSVYANGINPVAGFSGTVRVVVEVDNGSRLKLTSTGGVTAITQGYGSLTDGNATSIAFEGSLTSVNAALASLQVFNSDAAKAAALRISAVKAGSAYNPGTGHYYEAVNVPGGISWEAAKLAAEGRTFNGLKGYLATITNAQENQFILEKLPADGWIGATDKAEEGVWRWATGPENGAVVANFYTNWNEGEPNNATTHSGSPEGEDYAQFYVSGGAPGRWNDLPGAGAAGGKLSYYVVEYGGVSGDNPSEAAATASQTLTVQARPVITSNGGGANASISYAENGAAAVTTVTATDADAGDSKTFSISGTDADKFNINASTGALTFKASPNYEAPADSGANNSYEVTVRVTDSTGLFDEQAITVHVTNANDAPVLTGNLPTSITVLEDAAGNVDLSAVSIGDEDAGDTVFLQIAASKGKLDAAASGGVAVTGSGTATLALSGSASAVTAYLQTANNVQYTGMYNANGSNAASLTVSLKDDAGSYQQKGTVAVNITPVNDAPAGAHGTVTLDEDGAHTFSAADFGFTDPADAAGSAGPNTLQAVQITTLPTAGTLTLDGAAVAAGQSVAAADLSKLVFTPAAHANGSNYASFTFQVQDNGGTANGGVNLDPTPRTLTLSVTPVNDAPVLLNGGTSTVVLPSITENDTSNAGSLVSALVRAPDGGTDAAGTTAQSFVTDADFATKGSSEGFAGGIAIAGLTPGNGKWQYQLAGGSGWTDVGPVFESSALLLRGTDSIRFVPDEKNATTATFSYYIWDGSSGSAGNKVNVGTRGGSTAFSNAGDSASIAVTAVNDAPVLDLNGTDTGTGFTTVFRPLGQPVALVGAGVSITDVDKLADGTTPDTLTSAKVFISNGAVNNIGATKYESLLSTAGASLTTASGAVLTISGNGISSASPLTITGPGSWADYQEALQTLRYQNTSDSAVAGNRTISVSVTDAAASTGGNGALESTVATSTVQVVWAPVQDLNGSGTPGRAYSTTFTEDSPGVAIADANAVINSGPLIKQMVVTLTNPADGASGNAESLFIDAATLASLRGAGFTVNGDGTHILTLSGDLDKSLYGLALQAIQYKTTSQNPSTTDRVVQVAVTDVNDQEGAPVASTIRVVAVNDAPSGIALSADTIALNASGIDVNGQVTNAVTVGNLTVTDVDSTSHTLTVGGTDGALFEVVAGKLRLKPGTTLDPATKPSYAIRLTADDGAVANNTYTQDFTITLTENDAPAFSVATVSGNTVTLVFQDRSRLDSASVPAPSAFTVSDTTVTAVSIPNDASKTVVLTLATAPSGTITVGYTQPTGNASKLQDTSGNAVAMFSGKPVIAGTIDPSTSTITVSNGGTVTAPAGNFTLVNNGTDPVTLTGASAGQTVTLSGTGPTTISSPVGGLSVANNGTGTATVEGLPDGATLSSSGSGPTTISNPVGSLSVGNTGTGTVTVSGDLAGNTVTIDGAGSGPVAVHNTGSTAVTLASVNDGQTITASGSGPTTILNPDGNLSVANTGAGAVTVSGDLGGHTVNVAGTGSGPLVIDNTGTTPVTVASVNDGQAITTSGTGPTAISSPDGSLSVNNTGAGLVTVSSLHDGITLSASGTGPIQLTNPEGSLRVGNTGTGTVTVSGDLAGDTVTIDGAGTGPVAIHNTGSAAVTLASVNAGQTITATGSGPMTIAQPDGDFTLANTGSGAVTVTAMPAGATFHATGSGPVYLDLSHLVQGQTIAIDNAGAGVVHLLNVPDGVNVSLSGTGPTTHVPTFGGIPATAQSVTAGSAAALADFTVADRDAGQTLTVTLTATNGSIGGLTDADSTTPGIQLTGSASAINAALAGATFTAAGAGAASIAISVSDGVAVSPATATYHLSAQSPSSPPAPPAPPAPNPPSSATVDGVRVQTSSSTAGNGLVTTTTTVAPVAPGRVEDPGSPHPGLADIPLAADAGGALLLVGLPPGVGLRAESTGTGSLDLRGQLVQALQPKVAQAAQYQQLLSDGIDAYVASVNAPGQVTVRSITFDVASGSAALAGPIVVRGASGTGESDPAHPQRAEALVIDARGLPAGSVLDLNMVEFAIVLGPVRVIGGAGRNLVVGDDSAQFMVLGAEDDILRGGGGNDVVGSRGGNDVLYGDAGNDWLVGGVGDDTLHGGDGNDVLVGGASESGLWSFRLDARGQLHASYAPTSAELADGGGFSASGVWSAPGGQGALTDPRLSWVQGDYGTAKDIALLVHALFGRTPTLGEMGNLMATGLDGKALAQTAHQYWVHTSTAAGQTVPGQVAAVIDKVLGPGAANAQLVALGTEHLKAGGSWADIWLALARSDAHAAQLTDAQGHLSLVEGDALGELGWRGDAGANQLLGGAGNDVLVGGAGGGNVLDGGTGIDLAVYFGSLADYEISMQPGAEGTAGQWLVRHVYNAQVDTLRGVELLLVGGSVYELNTDKATAGGYAALAEHTHLAPVQNLALLGLPSNVLEPMGL